MKHWNLDQRTWKLRDQTFQPTRFTDGPLRLQIQANLAAQQVATAQPIDPLDVEYYGVTLRVLLERDAQASQADNWAGSYARQHFTPAQRAAISAHWSAQLRAKVAAGEQRERNVVTYCEVEPWE